MIASTASSCRQKAGFPILLKSADFSAFVLLVQGHRQEPLCSGGKAEVLGFQRDG